MFYLLTVILFVAFGACTLLLPFAFPHRVLSFFKRSWRSLAEGHRETVFDRSGSEVSGRVWLRVWGVTAVLALVALATFRTERFDNSIATTTWVATSALIALALSGLLVFSMVAYGRFFPRALGYQSLARCGFRSLWEVHLVESKRRFQEELIARINRSSSLSIIDVTGYKLLGKGEGPKGGLLFDALQAARKKTVCLMLFKPDTATRDPEGHGTVFESLLASMNLAREAYLDRLKATLEAVQVLNQERPAEFKIQVRYYTEKPTLQTLIFDDSAFAYPWQPREDHDVCVPFLEVAKIGPGSSLYESYRLQFLRLWVEPKANGSIFPRKRRKPQEKAPSARVQHGAEGESPWKAVVRNAGASKSVTV